MNTILTNNEIDAAWDGLTPSGYGKSRYDIARAVIAAYEAKLAQQKPVAWMRPSGKAMLETGGCCTVYASDGMSNHSAPLYTHPAPQQADRQRQPEAPTDPIRVACISLDGITLTVPAAQLDALGVGDEGDNDTYALTFKTMTRAEYDALGEFDGF